MNAGLTFFQCVQSVVINDSLCNVSLSHQHSHKEMGSTCLLFRLVDHMLTTLIMTCPMALSVGQAPSEP